MHKDQSTAKKHHSFSKTIYWMAGLLLVLTMFSTYLTNGIFAKYVRSDKIDDNAARVANSGGAKIELWEHAVVETGANSGIYTLLTNSAPVTGNTYNKVLPGVDIPKDPFICLEIDGEVSYELYVKVTEKNFPTYTVGSSRFNAVTYELTENWVKVGTEDGADIYRYASVFEAGTAHKYSEDTGGVIKILKDDTLRISEHYTGNHSFSITFNAYLKQVRTN